MAAHLETDDIRTFLLDLSNEQLRRAGRPVDLRPKTWGVLRYLATRPGELVTKGDLLRTIWADAAVTEGTLSQCIRELREIFGDDPQNPRFIETVHRRGFRWIAGNRLEIEGEQAAHDPVPQPMGVSHVPITIRRENVVGRTAQAAILQERLTQALAGERQVVFITGEPGIGKTTLLDLFLQQLSQRSSAAVLVARGQCIEQRQNSEPYLPVLEALERLCLNAKQMLPLLRRYAPTWLVQMPWLVEPADLESMQRLLQGSSTQRMLRELTLGIEALTPQAALVLVLEDLHWSDPATVDLISALAQGREPARFLLLCTHRPADAINDNHPLAQLVSRLVSRKQAMEIPLPSLAPDDVATYIDNHFGAGALPAQIVAAIADHSDGSPLFMVTALEYLRDRGWVAQRDGHWHLTLPAEEIARRVPDSLRQMIDVQLDRLAANDRAVLEVASVSGVEFSARAVAAGLEADIETVETDLNRMAASGLVLRPSGMTEWPDGVVAGRFEFGHALQAAALYDRIAPARRRQLHQRIATRMSAAYGNQVDEVAAKLAVHFERAGDHLHAAAHLLRAARIARARWADREAVTILEHALALNETLPPGGERTIQEIDIRIVLSGALGNLIGRASRQVGEGFARAAVLSTDIEDYPRLFASLVGTFSHQMSRADVAAGTAAARRLCEVAKKLPIPEVRACADTVLGAALCTAGELLEARVHLERSLDDLRAEHPVIHLFRQLNDPRVLCLSSLAAVLAGLGFADQARRRCAEAIAAGAQLSPYSHAWALNSATTVAVALGDRRAVAEFAGKTWQVASERGFHVLAQGAAIARDWAEHTGSGQDDWRDLRRAFDTLESEGHRLLGSISLLMLAQACLESGAIDDGLGIVTEGFAYIAATGERFQAAEFHRLRAELLIAHPQCSDAMLAEAEGELRRAIDVTRAAAMKLAELRAANALTRLHLRRGNSGEAAVLLVPLVDWFTEGRDLPDLIESQKLIASFATP